MRWRRVDWIPGSHCNSSSSCILLTRNNNRLVRCSIVGTVVLQNVKSVYARQIEPSTSRTGGLDLVAFLSSVSAIIAASASSEFWTSIEKACRANVGHDKCTTI